MAERWIVGIDGSFSSRAALEWALEHAPRRQATIVAVQAYNASTPARVLAAVRGEHMAVGPAANALHELEAAISDIVAGGTVETQVIDGSPARALLDDTLQASALVVGRNGTGGRWHRAVGSVSRYCVAHADVPVVVVPSEWERRPTHRLTVGFDGSDHAVAALRWALRFADEHTEITAVCAIEVAPWVATDVVRDRLADELRGEERRLLDALHAADPDGRVARDVVVNSARTALARAMPATDAIVVGTRGAGRVSATLMGSVSTWLLDAATCPLVIVPGTDAPI